MNGQSRYDWLPSAAHVAEQRMCRLMLAAGGMFQKQDGTPDDRAWAEHLRRVMEHWKEGK